MPVAGVRLRRTLPVSGKPAAGVPAALSSRGSAQNLHRSLSLVHVPGVTRLPAAAGAEPPSPLTCWIY